MECWVKEPPSSIILARIDKMMEVKWGMKTVPKNSKGLIPKLKGLGWL